MAKKKVAKAGAAKPAAAKAGKASSSKSKKKVASKAVVAEIVDPSEESHESAALYREDGNEDFVQPLDSDESVEPLTQEDGEILQGDVELDESDSLSKKKKSRLPASAAPRALTTTDPLALYLSEIRKYNLLTREEEKALALRYYDSKDPEAAQALVKANLRFVVKVAAEYSKFGAKMIDLIQEGNVGLMHAVREFNPHKGARLITYAVWWIRGYIQEFLMRQYSMVRIGTTQNQRKLFYQLQKEKAALDAMGIQPNTALLSSRLGIPEDEVVDMAKRMSGRDVSLDRPVDEDSGTTMGEMQSNNLDQPLDEQLEHAEQIDLLKKKLEEIRPELSDREKIILDERLLNDEPLTLQEIGEKYGITREAVRQMENRLMKKIRAKMD